MIRNLLIALLTLVLPNLANADGFPSRPRFQSVGVGQTNTNTGQIRITGTAPGYYLTESDAPLNEKVYRIVSGAGDLFWGTTNDALGGGNNFFMVTRTGDVVDTVALAATTVTVNSSAVCTANGTNCPGGGITQGTFTVTWDDACTTSPTSTFDYVNAGGAVTLVLRSNSGFPCTSDSTLLTTTTASMPAAIRPVTSIASMNMYAGGTNNGTATNVCLTILSTGIMAVTQAATYGASCTAWAAAANKSPGGLGTFTYIVPDP